jgi:hypothetical protein
MKPLLAAGFGALFAATLLARAAPAEPQNAVPATLLHSLDAQKTKPGDQVSAKTGEPVMTNGKVLVPKGSTLKGHVVEVKARTDDQPTSQLIVTFDRAVAKDGKEIPITASIASISRAQSSGTPSDAATGDMGIPSSSVAGTAGVPREGHSSGAPTGAPAPGGKGQSSETRAGGAFTVQQRADGSVISSNTENVHLSSGTQLLMRVRARE